MFDKVDDSTVAFLLKNMHEKVALSFSFALFQSQRKILIKMYRKVDERFIVESLIYTRFDVLIDILLKKASSLFDDRVDFVPIGRSTCRFIFLCKDIHRLCRKFL